MTKKSQTTLSSAAVLLLSGLLLCARPAIAAPVALTDRAMDRVTAGEAAEGGGVVVGNSSEAVVNRTTGLDLSGKAQQGAKGLNIVNSTESAVANVVNVWDGGGITAATGSGDETTGLKINQLNNITQEQVRSATLSGYLRSEAEHAETLSRSANLAYASTVVDHHSVTNRLEETRILHTVSDAAINTLLKFDINGKINFSGHLGTGIAAAGHTEINYEGGSADIAAVLDGDISAAGDGSLDADGKLVLVTRVELPSMNLVIDGVGCGVALGSCSANSETFEQISTKKDNSTLDVFETHLSGQSSFSEAQTTSYRSPFELKNAKAEYIVLDDSSLELDSEVALELSDSAQKDIKGMNIVNAIGSNVANSTNVSRTTRFEGSKATLVLNQFNTVRHGH